MLTQEERNRKAEIEKKLAEKGLLPDGYSPDVPERKSNMSNKFMERLKIGFGNDKGKVMYLKKNAQKLGIEDATINAKGELVVKEGGSWKRLNPPGPDVGDIANMVGHSVVPAGASIGTGAGFVAGGPMGSVVGATAGGAGAEGVRQDIGAMLGTNYTESPADALQAILAEGSISGISQAVALGAVKGLQALKGPAKQALAKTLENTANIPSEFTAYAMEHPEVLKNVGDIKLPSGRIYKISQGVQKQILEALDDTGKAIGKSVAGGVKANPANVVDDMIKDARPGITIGKELVPEQSGVSALIDKDAKAFEGAVNKVKEVAGSVLPQESKEANLKMFNINDLKERFITGVQKQIDNWGGVDRFTATDKTIIADIMKDIDDAQGRYGAKVSFNKLHNIKEKIYDLVKFEKGKTMGGRADTPGESYLKGVAKDINTQLGDAYEPYKLANQKFSQIKEATKGLPSETTKFVKNLKGSLIKVVKGNADEITMDQLEKLDDIYKTVYNKSFLDPVKKMAEEYRIKSGTVSAFKGKVDPSILASGLTLSGGSALQGGINTLAGQGTHGAGIAGTLGLLLAMSSSPKVAKLGIQGASLLGKVGRRMAIPEGARSFGIQAIPRLLKSN